MLATSSPPSWALSCFSPSPPRSSLALGRRGRSRAPPSLASELLGAEVRFLFIVGDGGEDVGFPEVGLVGEKSVAVEVKVKVGHEGPRR